MSRAAAACLAFLLLSCDDVPNPIASCGSVADGKESTQCLSLRLAVKRLESSATSGRITATVIAENSCGYPVAVLASPIDTRTFASDAWEQSLGSAYARLAVYERRTVTGGLDDIGFVVQALPQFVVVPARTTRTYELTGESPELAGLDRGTTRFVEFCTFAAPSGAAVEQSATRFSIDRTIEAHERGTNRECAVTLRRSAALTCTPPVAVVVHEIPRTQP